MHTEEQISNFRRTISDKYITVDMGFWDSKGKYIEDFQKVDKRDLSKIRKAIYGNRRS